MNNNNKIKRLVVKVKPLVLDRKYTHTNFKVLTNMTNPPTQLPPIRRPKTPNSMRKYKRKYALSLNRPKFLSDAIPSQSPQTTIPGNMPDDQLVSREVSSSQAGPPTIDTIPQHQMPELGKVTDASMA